MSERSGTWRGAWWVDLLLVIATFALLAILTQPTCKCGHASRGHLDLAGLFLLGTAGLMVLRPRLWPHALGAFVASAVVSKAALDVAFRGHEAIYPIRPGEPADLPSQALLTYSLLTSVVLLCLALRRVKDVFSQGRGPATTATETRAKGEGASSQLAC